MKFDNISSNQKINQWIRNSIAECRHSYPILEKANIAFDIGANIGGFCVHANEHFNKIYAFEPMLENFRIAESLIDKMNLYNVELYNTALYSKSGLVIDLYGNFNNPITGDITLIPDAKILSKKAKYNKIDQTCETISLKDAMEALGIELIDYLKLDCEGSEYAILENFNDYEKIKMICIEIHDFFGIERKINLIKKMESFYNIIDLNNMREWKEGNLAEAIAIEKRNVNNYEKSNNFLMVSKTHYEV